MNRPGRGCLTCKWSKCAHRMRQHPMYVRGIGDDALCRSAAANRGATQKCRQKKIAQPGDCQTERIR